MGVAFWCGVYCWFGLGFYLFVGILFGFLLLFCSVEMVLQCGSVLFCMQAVTRTCHNHLGAECQMLVGMTLPSLATFLCHLAVKTSTMLSVSKLPDTIL